MSKNLKLLEEFNFLNEVEHGENISKERLTIFLKGLLKNKKLLKDFFCSNIPLNHIDILTKCDVWQVLLSNYFSSDRYCNDCFLKIVLKHGNTNTVIKTIKLKQAFNYPKHWKSFHLLQHSKATIYKSSYKEFEFIKKTEKYWLNLEKQYFNKLVKYNLEDILIQFTSYYQKFKNYSKKTPDNQAIITSREAILIELLDYLLIKVSNYKTSNNKTTNFYSKNKFSEKLKKELPPIKPDLHTFPEESISKEKKELRGIIEFYFSKYDEKYQLNKYLSGYAEFEYIDELEAEITTNKEHQYYRQSLEKGDYEENYITNSFIGNSSIITEIQSKSDFWDKEIELKVQSSLHHFKFYNVPNIIDYKETKIELYKVLYVLHTFSSMLFPQGRIFTPSGILKREIKKSFINIFTPKYVVPFTKQELIENIITYFKYPLKEVEIIIDFLLVDLDNSKTKKVNIKTHPFIKIGDTIYWMSSFLRDIKWGTTLYRRLWLDKDIDDKIVSANTEKSLSNSFKEAQFNTTFSFKYNIQNQKGEIDVIAFKNNTLFIVELKNTIIVEDMLKTKNYENEKFSQKASSQLYLAEEYIINNFDEFSENTNLNIDISLEKLTIHKLIVSNSFQADNLTFNNDILKVSLFELTVILKNDLYNVLISKIGKTLLPNMVETPLDWMMNLTNRNSLNSKQTPKEVTKESTELWKNKNECTPNDIIEAILNNKVFKNLEENNHYHIETIELKGFDPDLKYLN